MICGNVAMGLAVTMLLFIMAVMCVSFVAITYSAFKEEFEDRKSVV